MELFLDEFKDPGEGILSWKGGRFWEVDRVFPRAVYVMDDKSFGRHRRENFAGG